LGDDDFVGGYDEAVVVHESGTRETQVTRSPYLFALLDKLGWAMVDLPAPDEVVYHAQDENEGKDGTGPVLQRKWIVSFRFRITLIDSTLTSSCQMDPSRRRSGRN
jgi:hypothetical protein